MGMLNTLLRRARSATPCGRRLLRSARTALLALLLVLAGTPGLARAAEGEIRIGNTAPYTGPAAAYGILGKVISAYFQKINAEGGIRGRKITFVSYDDGYNPQKTAELTRRLVEEDKVDVIFASVGTATSAAVRPYLNANRIPQLFVGSGASIWDQPRDYPWTMGAQPSYQIEAHIHAQYLLEQQSGSTRIGVLYQDDEFGKDYLKGLKDGLGGKLPIVAEAAYAVTDADINQQIAKLKAAGANVLVDVSTPKFTVLAIRRLAEIGWRPEHIIPTISDSVAAVLQPAGLQNAEGLLSATILYEGGKDGGDPGFTEWSAFMDRYAPDASKNNSLGIVGYALANLMVTVLRNCGDDFSRDNIMKQARSLKGVQLPMLIPGIVANTSASDHAPIEQMQMKRFVGGRWQRFGPVRSGIDPGAVSDSFKAIFRYASAKRDLASQLNANTVSLMTGSYGSTYSQMGADVASVLNDGLNLRIMPALGSGSVQAVADILMLKGVDVGIVRKDTLSYLERKDFASNIRNQLVYVTKMFNEEMHVLARRSIRTLRDLDGRTVAVDLPDGSTFVTAINVFERLEIKPHLLYIEPRIALDMLRRGEIDAIMTVDGKPVPWLSQVSDADLHLVPVGYDKPLRDDYLPSRLTADDYPNLIAKSEPVDTIAAEAILASYNWQPGSDRYRRLSLLVESLFSRIAQLQKSPFHPKWREMAPRAPVAGWTRFRTAQEWLDRSAGMSAPAAAAPVAASLAKPVSATVTAPPGAATTKPQAAKPPQPSQTELYRRFMEWNATRR
ncbi:putative ABC/TRAP transporter component (Periplasmic binding protein-like I) [Bradyrhizobium sp. ORS 375]|uniref:ABC transporter substrate-binding protein n=1 Tax=Bradyrhizobium sp. (strain ORS 375) TaxID=566679 RepID=UPI00024079B9|nr:ABC transporter substrate-binding protein [Bradyrhizobium sp. ORS 375]CCD90828.1 putative ABC/TRAP transporter component (Periplasmic binding protein-like I) [Bradyrhizobium sp. ORS 375]